MIAPTCWSLLHSMEALEPVHARCAITVPAAMPRPIQRMGHRAFTDQTHASTYRLLLGLLKQLAKLGIADLEGGLHFLRLQTKQAPSRSKIGLRPDSICNGVEAPERMNVCPTKTSVSLWMR